MLPKKKTHSMLPILLILLLLLSLGIVLAGGEQLSRSLITSGGSIAAQNELMLHSATGQPAAGTVQNELLLCSGYWCNSGVTASEPSFDLYLPAFNS